MNSSKTILNLDVPVDLMSVVSYYEVYCMMACCGTSAVDLSPVYAVNGMMDHGLEWAERGLAALDSVLAVVKAHDGPVRSGQDGFGHYWDSSSQAACFLGELRKTLVQGIAHVRRHGLVRMPSIEAPSLPN
jgi:hypothetical protein